MTDLTVDTVAGKVRGTLKDGVRRWMGVPYARQQRFAAPGPVAPWDGVRDASKPGSSCPQMFGNSAKRAMIKTPEFAEDCLDLNIYVPEGGEAQKPVYVWIHGGAFVVGNGGSYDGSAMAKAGDIIVVTINYRVGILGFVNFGEVLGLPDIPSNLGLRDQIAALIWVRDNIAAFGGDSARVTIGGQSAGSMSVSLLLHAKESWPLYRGAIMQSGAVSLIHSHEMSRKVARRYAELLDLDQSSLEAMRKLPLSRLFEAQAQVGKEFPGTIPASPWFDGDLLPESIEEAHRKPAAPVPLLAGAARDEIRLFELMPGDILPTKWHDLELLLTGQLGADHAARVLAAYPRTTQGRRALATDLTFVMPTRNFAERHTAHQPTWYYRFDYSHPIAGATHGLDLTLTWPMESFRATLARGGPLKGKRKALGERMIGHYAHFVRHLTPGEGWPAYKPEERPVMIFNYADRLESNPDGARLAAWAGRDVGAGLI
jgi:para-nitrobenzyl esterase